jgi:hypothetical protein
MGAFGLGGLLLGPDGTPGPAVPFTPISLSPLVWLRSDLGITTISGNVSTWADQSGNGYNVSQSNGSDRPTYNTGGLNGRQKLTWTSGNMFLQNTAFTFATNTQSMDIFVVATLTTAPSTGAGNTLIDLGSNNDSVLVVPSASTLEFYNGGQVTTLASLSSGVGFVVEAYNNPTSSGFIALNGGSQIAGNISSNAQGATDLTVGCYQFGFDGWVGDIYEVLLFNYELSAGSRNALLNYFTNLYGIAT